MSGQMKEYVFTLYLAFQDAETENYIHALREALQNHLPAGSWTLDVVDVIEMPEKALMNDVFTTPTLVRELPEPVLKVLGKLAELPKVKVLIDQVNDSSRTIIT